MATGQHPEDVQSRSSVWRDRILTIRQAEAKAQAIMTADALKQARQRRGRHS